MEWISRKPTRMPGFNYSSQNYYFITICTHNKKCIFGTVKHLNEWGKIAEQDLKELASHFKDVYVDNYIVMPNHIHAIVVLNRENAVDLNSIIGLYKSGVSRKIHKTHPETTVWQRSFHDRIIRNQKEYAYIWQYIQYNDQKWEQDCFYQNTDEI